MKSSTNKRKGSYLHIFSSRRYRANIIRARPWQLVGLFPRELCSHWLIASLELQELAEAIPTFVFWYEDEVLCRLFLGSWNDDVDRCLSSSSLSLLSGALTGCLVGSGHWPLCRTGLHLQDRNLLLSRSLWGRTRNFLPFLCCWGLSLYFHRYWLGVPLLDFLLLLSSACSFLSSFGFSSFMK